MSLHTSPVKHVSRRSVAAGVLTLACATNVGPGAAAANAASMMSTPRTPEGSGSAENAERAHGRAFSERSMQVASRYEGAPYQAGGDSPRGFDCSGYTQYVYAELGKEIPRTSQRQLDRARKVVGQNPQVGDLVFFHSGNRHSVYHVGIYAGKNKIWHAPNTGESVSKDKIWTEEWIAGRY